MSVLLSQVAQAKTKIVFVAGKDSHGYLAHEHEAGCHLLAKQLEKAYSQIEAVVVVGGYPENKAVFKDAKSVVVYCDGGTKHVLNPHLDEFDELIKKGVGLVCLHYGVETPIGKEGDAFLTWIGGFFETHYSVNPHWTAEFTAFPDHPITNGVQPFSIEDEWYFNMRFVKGMKNVTPILSAVPPLDTFKGRDEENHAHRVNPIARKMVKDRLPQHVAWAYERADGGRGFGFTGGHFHWNWCNDNFRKLVHNAIAWTAGLDIPKEGIVTTRPTLEELRANRSESKPKKLESDLKTEEEHFKLLKSSK